MSLADLQDELSKTTLASEADVRSKVVIPLFRCLGYTDAQRAEEFPVHLRRGRRAMNPEHADLVFFGAEAHADRILRTDRHWVQKHSLVLVEVKNPAEAIADADIHQTEAYNEWIRAPRYVLTNGRRLVVCGRANLGPDRKLLECEIEKLNQHRELLERLLTPSQMIREKEEPMTDPEVDFSEYLSRLQSYSRQRIRNALTRTLTESVPLPLLLSEASKKAHNAPISPPELLRKAQCAVVLAEVGGGKSFLLTLLAVLAAEGGLRKRRGFRIPVLLEARLWNRTFKSVAQAVTERLGRAMVAPSPGVIAGQLRDGAFLMLVDGLDEVREAADALHAELVDLARFTDTPVIATCRTDRYGGELDGAFARYQIDPLEPRQVRDTAERVCGPQGVRFLNGAAPAVLQLIRNPLFLMMTLGVIKEAGDGTTFRNKAELYGRYARSLLTEWQTRRSGGTLRWDSSSKERVLAAYAVSTFGRSANEGMLMAAIRGVARSAEDADRLRAELVASGLLIASPEGPEFLHPSFQEYFAARHVALGHEDQIGDFVAAHSQDDSYREVFVFLAGVLRETDQQALLLDHLEGGRLDLYRRCLESRFKMGIDETERRADFAARYLEQVLTSYMRIVNAHFADVRALLEPWRLADDPEAPMAVRITGSLDVHRPALRYELGLQAEGSPGPLVSVEGSVGTPRIERVGRPGESVPVISLSMSDGYTYFDLAGACLGIDSAREIAFAKVRESVTHLIRDKMLLVGEDDGLACEYIEWSLRRMRRRYSPQPDSFRNLSLFTHSPEEILHILEANESAADVVATSTSTDALAAITLGYHLNSLRIRKTDVSRHLRQTPSLICTETADLAAHIAFCYNTFQTSYRHLVDKCFPTLRDLLSLYRVGPVRFRVLLAPKDAGVNATFMLRSEPVRHLSDAATEVELCDCLPDISNELPNEAVHFRRALRALGRHVSGAGLLEYHRVARCLGNEPVVREMVYNRLAADMAQLLGR